MVKPEIVGKKLTRAAAWLDDAESLLAQPAEEFLANTKDRDLASFYLLLAIQECIDLAAHWVADAGWGSPDDAGSAFFTLANRKLIDRDLAEKLRKAVGLRNLIAHGYSRIDHSLVLESSREGILALRRFLSAVASEAGL